MKIDPTFIEGSLLEGTKQNVQVNKKSQDSFTESKKFDNINSELDDELDLFDNEFEDDIDDLDSNAEDDFLKSMFS